MYKEVLLDTEVVRRFCCARRFCCTRTGGFAVKGLEDSEVLFCKDWRTNLFVYSERDVLGCVCGLQIRLHLWSNW